MTIQNLEASYTLSDQCKKKLENSSEIIAGIREINSRNEKPYSYARISFPLSFFINFREYTPNLFAERLLTESRSPT